LRSRKTPWSEESQEMEKSKLLGILKALLEGAHQLSYDIETLPASERQTALSLKSSATGQEIQGWIDELQTPETCPSGNATDNCGCKEGEMFPPMNVS
jgi:hypothetical protein